MLLCSHLKGNKQYLKTDLVAASSCISQIRKERSFKVTRPRPLTFHPPLWSRRASACPYNQALSFGGGNAARQTLLIALLPNLPHHNNDAVWHFVPPECRRRPGEFLSRTLFMGVARQGFYCGHIKYDVCLSACWGGWARLLVEEGLRLWQKIICCRAR